MARVRLVGATKRYGSVVAVSDLNLEVREKEFVTLLGPSGCGKTTALKLIAGIEECTEGRVYFDEDDVTTVPPNRRDVAMVFQSYALYPHMNVFDNIAFPLQVRKVPKKEIRDKVERVARRLNIEGLLSRQPKQLSGGERQRVALGRAMIREPRVFLMDEPLSNLDANLRITMRQELKKLHHALQATFIYVTHDQDDALSMGDRVAVLNKGVLQQFSTPDEIYNRPRNRFVAGFLGKFRMNFLEGTVDHTDSAARFCGSGVEMLLSGAPAVISRLPVGRPVTLGVRPESIQVQPGRALVNGFLAEVMIVEPIEPDVYITVQAGGCSLTAKTAPELQLKMGDTVSLAFSASKLHFFDPATGERLGPD